MSISGISAGSMSSGGFDLRVKAQQAEIAEDALVDSGAAVQATPAAVSAGSKNMLARNFAGGVSNESKYLNATLAAFKIEDSMRGNAKASLLDLAGGLLMPGDEVPAGLAGEMAALGRNGPSKYAAAALHRLKVERMARDQKDKETVEESEEHLEESREDIKKTAEEAVAPENGDGDVVQAGGEAGAEVEQEQDPPTLAEAIEQAAEKSVEEPSDGQGAAAGQAGSAAAGQAGSSLVPAPPLAESVDLVV